MFTFNGTGDLLGGGIFQLGLSPADFVIIAFGVLVVFVVSKTSATRSVRERLYERPILSAVLFGVLFIVTVTFGAYGVGYDASQFIYNQF